MRKTGNKKLLTWLSLALALALLTTCGPKQNCAESHNDDRTRRSRICTNKKKYDFGEPIYITFTVTNVSDEPLVLNGGEKAAIDIRVQGEHWSDKQELTPETTRVTLEPGESRTIQWVWPTHDTDLEAVKRGFAGAPEAGLVGICMFGVVRPLPWYGRGVVGVYAYYRYPER